MLLSSCPVVTFHTRIVQSYEPETIHCPSGEKATELTGDVCPVNGVPSISPVVTFHTRLVLSPKPVNGLLSICPVDTFHTPIVPSVEPETICCPSGEKETDVTSLMCPISGFPSICPV